MFQEVSLEVAPSTCLFQRWTSLSHVVPSLSEKDWNWSLRGKDGYSDQKRECHKITKTQHGWVVQGVHKYSSLCECVGGTSKGKHDFGLFLWLCVFRKQDTYGGALETTNPMIRVQPLAFSLLLLHPKLFALEKPCVVKMVLNRHIKFKALGITHQNGFLYSTPLRGITSSYSSISLIYHFY